MADYSGFGPGMRGFLTMDDKLNQDASRQLQNQTVQQGLLEKMQAQQEMRQVQQVMMGSQNEDDAINKLRSMGTPAAMKVMKTLQDAKLQKAQAANYDVTGRLHEAQIGEIGNKQQEQQRQLSARQGLLSQLTQSQYRGETSPGGPQPQLFANDQEAIAAMKEAEKSGQQIRADVNNPNVTKALAVAAQPHEAIPELLRQMRPGGPGQNLAPRQVQDPESPTGWSWQDPRTGQKTPGAPVPQSVIGQQNVGIRGRIADYQVGGGTPQPAAQPAMPAMPQPGLPGQEAAQPPAQRQVPPAVSDAITKQTTSKIVKSLEENYTRLRDAPQQLSSIEEAKKLIPDAKVFQGPLGEQKLWVNKFFNANTPIKMNVANVNSAEELRTRIFMNVMDNLKKMDAQPSQLQQQIMQKALGDLGTDPNALSHVLDAYGDAIRAKVGIYQTQVKEAEALGVRWPHKIEVQPRVGSATVERAISKSGKPMHKENGQWVYD